MPTISFSRPFSSYFARANGAVAYVAIYIGKLTGGSGAVPPGTSKGKRKTRRKNFKKIGEVPYKYLSTCSIKDKRKGLDEATFVFANVDLSAGDTLLDLFLEGEAIEIVWGVRGLWHFKRRMQIRDVDTSYGSNIQFSVTANGSGARLVDLEETKSYNGRRVSVICDDIAQRAGMRFVSDIKGDPIIQHLSAGRRSAMEVLYSIAKKYGYVVKVINNVVYLNEINTDGQPTQRFDFAGPRGNLLSFRAKSSITGIRGSSTKVKNREDKSKGTKAIETKTTRSLQINYRDTGPGYKSRVVVKKVAKPTKPDPKTTDRQKRTTHTLRQGNAAGRVAHAANVSRSLRVTKGTLSAINEPLVSNSAVYVGNLNAKYNGRYCVHDVTYTWTGGVWVVSAEVSRSSGNRKPGGNKKKGSKAPEKGRRKNVAKPKPKIVIRYRKSGAYEVTKTGTGSGGRNPTR